MNIAFDFDGTITKNPFLFKYLMELLSKENNVYIISGTAEEDTDKLLNELYKIYDIQIKPENIILKKTYGNVEETTKWKYDMIDKYKIRLYFENRLESAKKISELCTVFNVL